MQVHGVKLTIASTGQDRNTRGACFARLFRMAALPSPQDVPGLEDVALALESARQLRTEGPPFSLCICDDQRQLIAAATLDGFDRVKEFSRAMSRLGYAAGVLGDPRAGCDGTVIPADAARDIFDDGAPQTDPAPL